VEIWLFDKDKGALLAQRPRMPNSCVLARLVIATEEAAVGWLYEANAAGSAVIDEFFGWHSISESRS